MRHERLFYYQIKFRVYGFYVAGTFKTYQTEQRKNNCKAFIFSLSRVGNSSLSGRQETTPPSPRHTLLHYNRTHLSVSVSTTLALEPLPFEPTVQQVQQYHPVAIHAAATTTMSQVL